MMQIDFQQTGVSDLIKDYLAQKAELSSLYNRFPEKENYTSQAKEKLSDYKNRTILAAVLKKQMEGLNLSEQQKEHLTAIEKDNAVTITTGHQLNLLTGPLYFLYKILHTVKICDTLNAQQKDLHYVPIYWMATEDHDFEEINHFHTYQHTYSFEANRGGFVGDIDSSAALPALEKFISNLPENIFSNKLEAIIRKAYQPQHNLATATRILVQELLGEYGVLILDGNDVSLKESMKTIFEKELMESPTQTCVQHTNQRLDQYKNQAYAREINLFYLHKQQRERIEKTKDGFRLVESGVTFSTTEMIKELHQYPAKFSPNVILRPLYQEVILPNVAYVGGGGEIAYWLQLKSLFDYNHVPFPMLVLRNSMVIVPNAIKHKANTYDLLTYRMFEHSYTLKNKLTERKSELFEALDHLKHTLENQFIHLADLADKTNASFGHMVQAQKQKQLNGFDKMHARLIKAEQKRFKTEMDKIDEIYAYLFPKSNWQERVINFGHFYQHNGDEFLNLIYEHLPPFSSAYNILSLDSIAKK